MRADIKFYIASKVKHAARWRKLQNEGYKITSTWIYEAGEGETASYSELAARCCQEISASDFLLLYCEPGEILKGALIECGMALALGKQIRCVGSCKNLSRVFSEHPLWKNCFDLEQALFESL